MVPKKSPDIPYMYFFHDFPIVNFHLLPHTHHDRSHNPLLRMRVRGKNEKLFHHSQGWIEKFSHHQLSMLFLVAGWNYTHDLLRILDCYMPVHCMALHRSVSAKKATGVNISKHVVVQACEDLAPGVVFAKILRKFGFQYLPECEIFIYYT